MSKPSSTSGTKFAQDDSAGAKMDQVALRDHARGILDVIATDLDHAQSAAQQDEKSKGQAPHCCVATEAETARPVALRRRLRRQRGDRRIPRPARQRAAPVAATASALPPPTADDITRFNEAIDQAVAESLASFTELKERRNRLFEALLSSSPDLNYIVETDRRADLRQQGVRRRLPENPGRTGRRRFLRACASRSSAISKNSSPGRRQPQDLPRRNATRRPNSARTAPTNTCWCRCSTRPGAAKRSPAARATSPNARQSEERIRRSANHDFLTDLPNRSLFRERLEHEIKHSARTGLPLGLLFIDLDGFKEVNDRLGHAAGDQMLQQVAMRISACVRDTDTVARLGGDEFTVILTDVTAPSHIETIAAEIIDELRKPFALAAGAARISGSIGITIYPGDAPSPDELVRNADEAMYASKNAGRNRYQFFTLAMRGDRQCRRRARLSYNVAHSGSENA